LISVSVMCGLYGRFFESPSHFGLGPAKRGIPGAVGEETITMRENEVQEGHTSGERSPWGSPCEIDHLFDGASCVEAAEEEVDGLLLCERHALEVKLEGQISCWEEMLFHIELWSREAARREREAVVELLDVERARAMSARQRAYEDLDVLRRSEMPREHGEEPPTKRRRGSLLLLPPRGDRPHARGLRRPRRR
jgi:hypothetical protein